MNCPLRLSIIPFGFLLLLVACPEEQIDEALVVSSIAQRLCDVGCYVHTPEAICENDMEIVLKLKVARQLSDHAAGRLTFHPQNLDKCLDDINPHACGRTKALYNRLVIDLPHSCDLLYGGMTPDGDNCFYDSQCLTTSFCSGDLYNHDGFCKPRPAKGESCDGNDCVSPYFCDRQSNTCKALSDTEHSCFCSPPSLGKSQNEACELHSECAKGLYCQSPSKICVRLPGNGENYSGHNASYNCAEGLASKSGPCAPMKFPNDACEYGDTCYAGYCDSPDASEDYICILDEYF